MAMNRHDTKYDMCGHRHVQYTIDQNIHDEDMPMIKISMKFEDIQWIKISIMAEDIWHTLESSRESYNLMNTGMIKEVTYLECHQFGKYSTQNDYEYISYYVTKGVKVKHSSL